MRRLVAGAIYLASGALFNTMETVAGENPLCVATSRIVTAWLDSLDRFTRRAPWWATSSRQTDAICNASAVDGLFSDGHSGGASNDSGSRNHRVFQIPNAIPAIIQMPPTIWAGRLRLSHKPKQITKPSTGGIRFQAFFFSACRKYRTKAAALTPIKAIRAPKFSSSMPRPKVRKNEPTIARKPTKITLFRGT